MVLCFSGIGLLCIFQVDIKPILVSIGDSPTLACIQVEHFLERLKRYIKSLYIFSLFYIPSPHVQSSYHVVVEVVRMLIPLI